MGHSQSPGLSCLWGRGSWQRAHCLLLAKFIKEHLRTRWQPSKRKVREQFYTAIARLFNTKYQNKAYFVLQSSSIKLLQYSLSKCNAMSILLLEAKLNITVIYVVILLNHQFTKSRGQLLDWRQMLDWVCSMRKIQVNTIAKYDNIYKSNHQSWNPYINSTVFLLNLLEAVPISLFLFNFIRRYALRSVCFTF